MRVYVSVDIEGITGVVHADMMAPGQPEYHRGRALMTAEANAAIAGLVEAGAEYILVNDGHGPMRNLIFEDLHPAALLISGTGDAKAACQLEGADDAGPFDAAVFIGYHAMARTRRAIHAHTIAGACVSELRINGVPHGETGLNAGVLGSLGIPVVLLTGDDATTHEATAMLGQQLVTVTTKEARGRNAAILRPRTAVFPEITAAAARALTGRANQPVYLPATPWSLEVDLLTLPQAERASRAAGVTRVAPLTIGIEGDSPWQQYVHLWGALRAALYEPASFLA